MGAAGLILVGALAAHLIERPKLLPAVAPSSDSDELRAELALVRRQVELLGRRPAPPVVAPSDDPGESSTAPRSPSPAPAPPAVPLEERTREMARTLASRQEGEPVDAVWSVQTTDQIKQVIAQAALPIQLLDIRCSSTLCRVLLEHAEAETQSTLAEMVAQTQPFDDQVLYDLDTSRRPYRTTVFLSRKGHPLFGRVTR